MVVYQHILQIEDELLRSLFLYFDKVNKYTVIYSIYFIYYLNLSFIPRGIYLQI